MEDRHPPGLDAVRALVLVSHRARPYQTPRLLGAERHPDRLGALPRLPLSASPRPGRRRLGQILANWRIDFPAFDASTGGLVFPLLNPPNPTPHPPHLP